ncbi:HDOD domain-containing protein [Pseudomonas piscis]|uniref:HDOD domain-containing protein n=1 Tax=Pseudomonas piscis TaxID=2614538 RepID=UPI00384B83C4
MSNETSTPHSAPSSLEAWVKLLCAVRLPVPQASHDRVCKAIANNRSSLREIADLMQNSPALALSVIREANRHTHGSMSEPAENLEIAVNRLGLKRTQELLEQLPTLPEEQIPQALRQLQLISQHATQQANGFFAGRLARLWQDIHWGSLLFLSPLWAIALSYPKLMEEWELRVIYKHEPARKVELQLFGVRLMEVCQALVQAWHLPIWVQQGYRLLTSEQHLLAKVMLIARDSDNPLRQQQRLDDDPELRRWLNQPANCVLLANGMALAAQFSWNNPHGQRWQNLTALYLQIPVAEVQQQLHQQAANSARNDSQPDLWHPAQALLWPWNVRRLHNGELPAPAPTPLELAKWRQLCSELLLEPSPFTNAVHLTGFARDALAACGMRRIMLLMVDRSHSQLRVQQLHGLPREAAGLSLQAKQNPLLQRLLEKSAQVRLTPDNYRQFAPHLPGALRQLFRGEHLLIRSLSCNGRVLLLAIADQDGVPFAETSVQAFGKTAQCIEKALHSFTNRSQ